MRFLIVLLSVFFCFACQKQSESEVTSSTKKVAEPENIIFITIDTLRRDRVSIYDYPFDTSPFLSSLSKKGIVFENALTVSGQTAPSHTSMFTGKFPFRHGVVENGLKLAKKEFSLHKLLETEKIKNKALTAVKFLDGATGFPEGDYYRKKRKKKEQGKLKDHQQNAEVMLKRAKDWLSQLKKEAGDKKDRFFLWLHFFDVHSWEKERHLPDEYKAQIPSQMTEERFSYWVDKQKMDPAMFESKEQMHYQLTSYDVRLRYVDEQIKNFFNFVSEAGLNSNTLWVITADHGEGLGNHNYKLHGKYLYQEQLRIPLFFYLSGTRALKPARIKQQVSTVDFLPTIADILHTELPKDYHIDGGSFYNCLTGDCDSDEKKLSFAERRPKDDTEKRKDWLDGDNYSIQNIKSKYIYYSDGKDEFYDLEKDPFELNNLAKEGDSEQGVMKDVIEKITEGSSKIDSKEKKPFSPELVEELQSLGYM